MLASLLVALLVSGSLPLFHACAMDAPHHAEKKTCCCTDAPPCTEHAPADAAPGPCCVVQTSEPDRAPLVPAEQQVQIPRALVAPAALLGLDDKPSAPPDGCPPRSSRHRPAHPLSLHVVHATFLN